MHRRKIKNLNSSPLSPSSRGESSGSISIVVILLDDYTDRLPYTRVTIHRTIDHVNGFARPAY